MRHFQGSPIPVGAGRLYYRRWVEEGLISEIENPFEAVKWQQVLGGEGFLRKLKDHWNQKVERPKGAICPGRGQSADTTHDPLFLLYRPERS